MLYRILLSLLPPPLAAFAALLLAWLLQGPNLSDVGVPMHAHAQLAFLIGGLAYLAINRGAMALWIHRTGSFPWVLPLLTAALGLALLPALGWISA